MDGVMTVWNISNVGFETQPVLSPKALLGHKQQDETAWTSHR